MKLCIRAHDLGVTGMEPIIRRLDELGIDGIQLVCYKTGEDIAYAPGAMTGEKAARIGNILAQNDKAVALVGAYFNPVHENQEKVRTGEDVFADYLRHCHALGCSVVGSETGSYNNDSWTYHPMNRTEEAYQRVAAVFSRLCDVAQDFGSMVAMEGCEGHVCWDIDTLIKTRKIMGRQTKVIFDLYNLMDAHNQGDYLYLLEKGLDVFGGEIQVFHMKDGILANGRKPIQTPFGQGGLDLHAILSRIKSYDENAMLVLEETTGADIPHAVETLRRVWGEV